MTMRQEAVSKFVLCNWYEAQEGALQFELPKFQHEDDTFLVYDRRK